VIFTIAMASLRAYFYEMREARRRRNEIEKLISAQQALQCGDQFGSGGGFIYETVRAQEAHGRFGFRREFLHGEKENFGRRRDTANLEGGLNPIHYRHIDIQKHQVWTKRLYLIERLLTIFGFAADGEGVCVQEFAHGASRDVVIVNEKDFSRKSPPKA
jgi:hypothetical protein